MIGATSFNCPWMRRRALVRRHREAAKSDEARQLDENAQSIAALLNEDFHEVEAQIARARTAARGLSTGSKSLAPIAGAEVDDAWVEGGEELASPIDRPRQDREGGGGGGTPPDLPRPVQPSPDGSTTATPRGGEGRQRAPRGGFEVRFDRLGHEEQRSRYVADQRRILINLDHPQVAGALTRARDDVKDPEFVRLSWDVAIAEYAAALARIRDEAGHYMAIQDALFDVRESVDRLTRKTA